MFSIVSNTGDGSGGQIMYPGHHLGLLSHAGSAHVRGVRINDGSEPTTVAKMESRVTTMNNMENTRAILLDDSNSRVTKMTAHGCTMVLCTKVDGRESPWGVALGSAI